MPWEDVEQGRKSPHRWKAETEEGGVVEEALDKVGKSGWVHQEEEKGEI